MKRIEKGAAVKRLFALDLIRAVAVVMVVFDHSMRHDMSQEVSFMLKMLINPDAALFFMVSGALLLPVRGSYADFLRHRIVKVFVPYVVWVIGYAVMYYEFGLLNEYSLALQIRWSWMSTNFITGWFIPAIMSLYFVMPLLSPWIEGATRRRFHYVLVLWLVSGLLPWLEVIGGVDAANTPLTLIATAVPYAIMGYYLTVYRNRQPLLPAYVLAQDGDAAEVSKMRRRARRRKLAVVYALLLCAGLVFPYVMFKSADTINVADVALNCYGLPAIAMALLYFTLLARVTTLGKTADKVVKVVARYSYGMFLSHLMLSGYFLPRYLPELAASTLATFVLTLAGSMAVTWLLGKIPFLGRYLVGLR
ncbi:MAG: acyltransferase [Bacteroidales bacterium]|nr:acyltransferase [Bacteroidales bacterium]